MHDLATQDLALRIGGSKTGLVNASLVSSSFYFEGMSNLNLACLQSNMYVNSILMTDC